MSARTRTKKRANPAIVVTSIVATVLLASLAGFLLVFFLVIRPAEKGVMKSISGGGGPGAKQSTVDAPAPKKGAHPKAPKSSAAGLESKLESELEQGIVEAMVDSMDSGDVDRLTTGVVVPAASGPGPRKVPTLGQPPRIHKGRVMVDGPGIPDWVEKIDASSNTVRGPDGVLRPMHASRKPRMGAREQIDAMLKSRSNRGAPAVIEGWDRSALVADTDKVRSRDEMARINRRLAVAAAREKAAFPDGLPVLAGAANPYLEDLKARLP